MRLSELMREHGRPYATGAFAPPGSLGEGPGGDARMEPLREYKLRVAKRYRTLSPERVEAVLPEGKLYVSPKIDGELWFALRRDGETVLCAPNGRMLSGIPVVAGLEKALAEAGDALVAGELFVANKDEAASRPRVFHVAKALRDPEQAGRVGFKAFDVAQWQGEDVLKLPYEARLALLRALPETGPASRVATYEDTKRGVLERYREWVESKRYEGLVVRHDVGGIYKVKPEIGLDAVVVAWSERLVADRVELRELHVALMRDDGSFHVLGAVGTGLDGATRLRLQAKLSGLAAESSYRMANREGTLCRFVRPEVVVELKCSDLMAADPGEPPTLRMTLRYEEAGGWRPLEELPLPTLLGPVFVRERDDKGVNVGDVGLDQVRQITPFERDTEVALVAADDGVALARSTVVQRKVWIKQTKGATAVRKYVAWATNRAEEDPRFPPFVVAFTDFSAARKEPLQRDLRVASTAEKLDAQIAEWERDNIKKGWNPA